MRDGAVHTRASPPGMTRATLRTVREVFEKFGDKGRFVLGAGMAAKALIAEKERGKGTFFSGKDMDVYILSGKPFGEPELPHEHIKLGVGKSGKWVPVEAIYSPTLYFGFRKPDAKDVVEAKLGNARIPCISPEFYVASILSSVPYNAINIAVVGRLLEARRYDAIRIAELLEETQFGLLYRKELKHPEGFFSKGFHSPDGFVEDLNGRVDHELHKRFAWQSIRLPLDPKNAFDMLGFDEQTTVWMSKDFEVLWGPPKEWFKKYLATLDELHILFFLGASPYIFFNHRSEAEHLNISPYEQLDFAWVVVHTILRIAGLDDINKQRHIAFLNNPDLRTGCNLELLFRTVAKGQMTNEAIVMLFRLSKEISRLYFAVDGHFPERFPSYSRAIEFLTQLNLQFFLSGAISLGSVFVLGAAVEQDLEKVRKLLRRHLTNKARDSLEQIEKTINRASNHVLHGGRFLNA